MSNISNALTEQMAYSAVSGTTVKMLLEHYKDKVTLVENYRKANGKPFTLEQKAALVKTLRATEDAIGIMENIQASNIGMYKRFAIDMVGAIIPNLYAFDLVSVQPLDNITGVVSYIKYTYGSTKGATKEGMNMASALNLNTNPDPQYTSEDVSNEVVAALNGVTEVRETLQWSPVQPGTVALRAGANMLVDDGQGKLISAADKSNLGTINYATGEVSFTLGAAVTDDLLATYKYVNDYVPTSQIPQISLSVASLTMVAKPRHLAAVVALEAMFRLQKEYGVSMEELLASQAAAEISYEIDTEIANDLYKLAYGGDAEAVRFSYTQPTGVSLQDHLDGLMTYLNLGAARMHKNTGRVKPNFIIAGSGAGAIFQSTRIFQSSGETNAVGPYYAGMYGPYKVYIYPQFVDNAFVMGYKGNTLLETGYIYAPYMPIVTTDMVQLEDMAGRKGWATMYAKRMVNERFYIRGYIDNLPQNPQYVVGA